VWTQYFINVWRLKAEAPLKTHFLLAEVSFLFRLYLQSNTKCTRHGRSHINLQVTGFVGRYYFFDNFLKCIFRFVAQIKKTTTTDNSDNDSSLYLKSTSSRRHRKHSQNREDKKLLSVGQIQKDTQTPKKNHQHQYKCFPFIARPLLRR